MGKRRADNLGFVGRRQWVTENLSAIELVLLVPDMWNTREMLRCSACVVIQDGGSGWFLIDLTRKEYSKLPSVTGRSTASSLRQVLSSFPLILPGEEEQASLLETLKEFTETDQ
jgi:hypothetical protein